MTRTAARHTAGRRPATPLRAAVLGPSRAALTALLALPAQPVWVGAARHFTYATLGHWRLTGEERDRAVLIVGELAANAAQHGGPDLTLRLDLDAGTLRITVTDRGASGPATGEQPARADPDEHGRGMGIVGMLATWVEVSQDERGRRVRVGLSVAGPWPQAA